jgi:membrane-associated phospholipid phosphatase
MQIDPNPGTRSLMAALSCVVVVALCVAFVDRPLATAMHQTFHGARPFVLLTHIVDPVLPGAAFALIGTAVFVMSGWRPGRVGQTLITCCVAALMAYAIKDQAKFAFGRLWPETWVNNNPSWISNGAYGFSPFHGGPGWGSFPSGHMCAIVAPLAVVWCRLPRLRWLAALLVLLVAVGLIGANYHFLGDVIAGSYLGTACGLGTLAVLRAGWTTTATRQANGTDTTRDPELRTAGAGFSRGEEPTSDVSERRLAGAVSRR